MICYSFFKFFVTLYLLAQFRFILSIEPDIANPCKVQTFVDCTIHIIGILVGAPIALI